MKATLFDSRLERLREATVVAILRMASSADAIEGMGVAVRGGFEAVEVTMNTPGAADALSEVAGRIDAIVGAGTVLEPEQVKEAYDAGAEFIVTPVVVPEVVEAAHSLSLPVTLGASTPTEIYTARRAGADWVKVFPAESLGGPDYIEHVLGPLDDTPILVSGGITPENYLGYLDAGVELVAFGESVFSSQLAAEGRYDEIERRAVAVCSRLDMYITDHAEG
jgi:2-dehydro-3-deoxyphosphogluconate aldolase / (4S)-4-hydroxy-2-oxoglutarate aldolase